MNTPARTTRLRAERGPVSTALGSTLALLALAVLPVLMLVALAALALQVSHTQQVRRAELLTQNLAALLAQGLSADIGKIDLALVSIAEVLRRDGVDGRERYAEAEA